MAARSARIASLDGVRAFAIVTVLLAHLEQRFQLLPIPVWAPDGVELFFVLSGFLITAMLVRAQAQGAVSMPVFYWRRATRILPALLVYLAVVAAFSIGGGHTPPWTALASAALFFANIYPHDCPPVTQHLWSLALEEQFYFLWPPILLACLRFGGRRAATWATIALVAASPAFRIAVGLFHPAGLVHQESVLLPGRMDSLLCGALLALCRGHARWNQIRERMDRYPWIAPLFFIGISPVLRSLLGNAYTFTLGYTLESIAALFFLAWLLDRPASLTSRVLSLRPIAFLGVASYSMYLYQSFVITQWPTYAGGARPLYVLVAAVLAGLAAYLLVEVPVNFFRNRQPRETLAVRHLVSDSAVLAPETLGRRKTPVL